MHAAPTALERRRPSLHYYYSDYLVRARLVQSRITSNTVASPPCRRLPRIERAWCVVLVMCPAANPVPRALAVPPANPPFGVHERLRVVSWHELNVRVGVARARPPPCSQVHSRRRRALRATATPLRVNPRLRPVTYTPPPPRRRGALLRRAVSRHTLTACPARHIAQGFSAQFLQLRPMSRRPQLVGRILTDMLISTKFLGS
ncbi:hypothetical protein B0H15DRAFT_949495 [Mycena belliarum]|uniref:Uncharacterized protein n=1 Tax=Mycena belliarum TaxID=1033014 RepID=A0AAD6U8T6_9AGAR|nr:hypothetical protein B0H15DRAFT_949495 [Mycena belliae]